MTFQKRSSFWGPAIGPTERKDQKRKRIACTSIWEVLAWIIELMQALVWGWQGIWRYSSAAKLDWVNISHVRINLSSLCVWEVLVIEPYYKERHVLLLKSLASSKELKTFACIMVFIYYLLYAGTPWSTINSYFPSYKEFKNLTWVMVSLNSSRSPSRSMWSTNS